jgi:hypothetical protein
VFILHSNFIRYTIWGVRAGATAAAKLSLAPSTTSHGGTLPRDRVTSAVAPMGCSSSGWQLRWAHIYAPEPRAAQFRAPQCSPTPPTSAQGSPELRFRPSTVPPAATDAYARRLLPACASFFCATMPDFGMVLMTPPAADVHIGSSSSFAS